MWTLLVGVAIASACLASYVGRCWENIKANQRLQLVDHLSPRGNEKDGLLIGIRMV